MRGSSVRQILRQLAFTFLSTSGTMSPRFAVTRKRSDILSAICHFVARRRSVPDKLACRVATDSKGTTERLIPQHDFVAQDRHVGRSMNSKPNSTAFRF